jgi:hypothetical protein
LPIEFAFPASIFLLLLTAIFVIFVRTIPHNVVKTFIYLLLGFAAFWNVGSVYSGIISDGIPQPFLLADPNSIFGYTSVVSLALANSIALLIVVNDHPRRSMMFASMGFAIIIFPVAHMKLLLRPDIIVVVGALWLLTCVILTRAFSRARSPRYGSGDKVKVAIKSIFLSLPLYILLMFAYLLAAEISGGAANIPDAVDRVLDIPRSQLVYFLGGVAWRYVLFHFILLPAAMLVYDVALHAFNIERQLLKSGELRFIRKVFVPVKEEKKEDPFLPLIKEMKKFSVEKTDRITAAQVFSRYKSEFDILAQKHDTESKKEAEEILKKIEREIHLKYG